MTRVRIAALLLVLALSELPLTAQYVEMYRVDNRVKDLSEQDALNTLATHLGVPAETLKKEKAEYQSSIGQLYTAHQFAKQAGSDFKGVMTELRSGKSWGVIAKDRKIDMDKFSKDAKQLEEALKKTQRASK